MALKIKFFENSVLEATDSGIYIIYIKYSNEKWPLYIGESFSMNIRCAAHLYEFTKNPLYFGINKDELKEKDITLIFEILEAEGDKVERKRKEKEYIKRFQPITQKKTSDRMKDIDKKSESIREFL